MAIMHTFKFLNTSLQHKIRIKILSKGITEQIQAIELLRIKDETRFFNHIISNCKRINQSLNPFTNPILQRTLYWYFIWVKQKNEQIIWFKMLNHRNSLLTAYAYLISCVNKWFFLIKFFFSIFGFFLFLQFLPDEFM